MLLLVGVIVAACTTLVLYARYSFSYWSRRGVPQLPTPPFPLGHVWRTLMFKRCLGEVCRDLYEQVPLSEPLAGAYVLTKPTVIVRDPELIKNMLVKDFQHFHDRGLYINEDVDPLTGHLFFLPGEKWRSLRNKLSPTFTSGKMKMMFPTVEKCGRELADCLGSISGEVEFRDLLARYASDVIATCAFGLEAHSMDQANQEFIYWSKRLVNPTVARGLIGTFCNFFPGVANKFRIHTISPDVDEYFTNLIKKTMEFRDNNKISRADFLQLLMNLRDDESTTEKSDHKQKDSKDVKLTIGQLAAQCAVFFLAGFDTSSTTMSFALYELAHHQDIQRKLQQEIDDTLEKSGGRFTYDDIMNMEYLDKVVSETLRKYPPGALLSRVVTQEYKVPDTEWVLEKGTLVIIPVLGIHRDQQHYPDPERYDPERFSEEEKTKRHSFAYLPFGDGPRLCIGMRFGLMQTKIGLASLLSRYDIEICSRTVKDLKMSPTSFVLNPDSGIWLRYTSRVRG